jgi:isopenicillin-N N-acyltransferase-like protein
MQIKLLFFLLPAFLSAFISTGFAQTFPEGKTVPVIELSGDGYNRGFQHGTVLKKEIAAVYEKWKKNISNSTGKDPDTVLNAFRSAINFEPITRKYCPGILEEMKGIAAGSGQRYEDVYAFQLVDEFWIYLDKQRKSNNHHCSGMGVAATTNHPAYIAQNLDLENYMHGYQVLLHLAPTKTEPEQYILSCAGLVALAGMNEKGIGLCLNTLMELKASEDGLPVAFMIRGILAKQKGTDAMKMLQTVKHASGQNYILGIADSVYNFEASSNEVVRYIPKGSDGSLVYHTNHALVNHDVKEWYKNYHQQVLAGETKNRNSETRFASLEKRLTSRAYDMSVEIIKTTLRSKDDNYNPVCRAWREGGGGFTFSSLIFTLSGKRSLQLTYGSPDRSEYREYFFTSTK